MADVIKLFPEEHNKPVHDLMGMALQLENFILTLEQKGLNWHSYEICEGIEYLQRKFVSDLITLEAIINFIEKDTCQKKQP